MGDIVHMLYLPHEFAIQSDIYPRRYIYIYMYDRAVAGSADFSNSLASPTVFYIVINVIAARILPFSRPLLPFKSRGQAPGASPSSRAISVVV